MEELYPNEFKYSGLEGNQNLILTSTSTNSNSIYYQKLLRLKKIKLNSTSTSTSSSPSTSLHYLNKVIKPLLSPLPTNYLTSTTSIPISKENLNILIQQVDSSTIKRPLNRIEKDEIDPNQTELLLIDNLIKEGKGELSIEIKVRYCLFF